MMKCELQNNYESRLSHALLEFRLTSRQDK
jgi:hypothetical protein